MDHGQLSLVADKFPWGFSEPLLNACGTEEKLCRRQRIIPPWRLGLALTATCASQPVETLADFPRGFKALGGTTITYKAFSNQVAKPRNKPLKAIHATLPTRQRVARVVAWQVEGHPLRLRLLLSWNRQTQECCSGLPNLPAQRSRLDLLSRAYTWRWQVELLWKAWPSDATLHAFDTTHPAIVEGLLWTAMAAAALKRFWASMPQRLAEGPMSTRKVALCAVHG